MKLDSEQLKFEYLKTIYANKLQKVQFNEIEHIPNEMIAEQIKIEDNCLCIRYNFFDQFYVPAINKLFNVDTSKPVPQQMNMLAQVILIMNGQNDKAWSTKRYLLLQKKLDITRQLKFNAAICYKNKKSFLYYEFRLRLINILFKMNYTKEQLMSIYRKEHDLITKILSRFHRNYQCWLYKIKIYQLFYNHFHQDILQLQIQLLHFFIQRNPNDYSAYSRLINIVSKNKVDIASEITWIKDLQSFCVVAYQKQSSYKHITTYLNFLNKHDNL